jgi:hypothetical protein
MLQVPGNVIALALARRAQQARITGAHAALPTPPAVRQHVPRLEALDALKILSPRKAEAFYLGIEPITPLCVQRAARFHSARRHKHKDQVSPLAMPGDDSFWYWSSKLVNFITKKKVFLVGIRPPMKLRCVEEVKIFHWASLPTFFFFKYPRAPLRLTAGAQLIGCWFRRWCNLRGVRGHARTFC